MRVSDQSLGFLMCRGGRGDRTGRYGNTNNNHNFRDMDYRGYDQEEEETETDGFYGSDDQSSDVHDFRDRPAFPLRGDGQKDLGGEEKGIPWPPCLQPQPDLAPRLPHRMEKVPRREFEQSRTGLQERARGNDGRGFPENTAPVAGGRDGNWGHGGGHSDLMEYHTARQRDEDRFPRDTVKRRVSQVHPSHFSKFLSMMSAAKLFLCRAAFFSWNRGTLWEHWT